MKIFAIYDTNNRLYAVEYAGHNDLPERVDYIQAEIPDGAMVIGVDSGTKEVLYKMPPESPLEKEVKELRARVGYLTMMSGIEMEEADE